MNLVDSWFDRIVFTIILCIMIILGILIGIQI